MKIVWHGNYIKYFEDGRVKRVVEASGSTSLFSQALDLIQLGGTISIVAFYDNPLENIQLDNLVFGDITIKPVSGSYGTFKPVLQLMSSGMLDLSTIIGGKCKLEDIPEVVAELKGKYAQKVKMLAEIN